MRTVLINCTSAPAAFAAVSYTHLELALSAGVNPNTMQKALSELERDGYLESRRTSGRFVADIGNQADSLKNDLAHKLCSEFCEGMSKVGFTPEQSLTCLLYTSSASQQSPAEISTV